jgi:hypothetical protein
MARKSSSNHWLPPFQPGLNRSLLRMRLRVPTITRTCCRWCDAATEDFKGFYVPGWSFSGPLRTEANSRRDPLRVIRSIATAGSCSTAVCGYLPRRTLGALSAKDSFIIEESLRTRCAMTKPKHWPCTQPHPGGPCTRRSGA